MHTSKSQGAFPNKQVCCAYAGVKAAGHAAFVLVAGGLGERLGYSGIKLALPVDSASNKCFLQVGKGHQHLQHPCLSHTSKLASVGMGSSPLLLAGLTAHYSVALCTVDLDALDLSVDPLLYCAGSMMQVYIESILALQNKASAERGEPVKLEMVIMTSDDTHSRTQALLDDHNYFGMQRNQLHLLKQEKVCGQSLSHIYIVHMQSLAHGMHISFHGWCSSVHEHCRPNRWNVCMHLPPSSLHSQWCSRDHRQFC